jgi:hypothetical protein
MNRGQVAKAVRENKEKYPERYCSHRGCLWTVSSGKCPKHPHALVNMGFIASLARYGL